MREINTRARVIFSNHSKVGYQITKILFIKMLDIFYSVPSDIDALSKIPLLPSITSPVLKVQLEKPTLSDFLGSHNSQVTLNLARECTEFLKNHLESSIADIESRTNLINTEIGKRDKKEIRGLQARFQGLDALISTAKKVVSELDEFAKAFCSNQHRASNLRDPSIFPDLCKSHETQLEVMLQRYQALQQIRERCENAKKEFCTAIHRRLQDVLDVSKRNGRLNRHQDMLHQQYEKHRKYIKFFQNLHNAGETYCAFIGEVLRRRQVSKSFLDWANETSRASLEFFDNESAHRKEFNQKLSSHFLSKAFPGLDDMPSKFANEPPTPFDDRLPQITHEEITELKDLFPEYSSLLSVPYEVPFIPPRLVSPIEDISVNSSKRNEAENDDFEKVTSASENTTKSETPITAEIGCDPAYVIVTQDVQVNTETIQVTDVATEALEEEPQLEEKKLDEEPIKSPNEGVEERPKEETQIEPTKDADVTSTSNQKPALPSPSPSPELEKVSVLT